MNEFIPYGRQDVNEADVAAVADVLRSDYLTTGPKVVEFEQALGTYVGANHAFAMNSATSALHAAYLALGVGHGDRVWTCPNTFVASSNAALYCGAIVDFVDMDPSSYVMCADLLEAKLKSTKEVELPKVVVPVHFAGQSADMERIHKLGLEYGFKIVEDASHAVGATYQRGKVGNCAFSDMAVFSFHPVKILTTGEGGMVFTNDANLAKRLALFRSHGITRDAEDMVGDSHGAWYYQQVELGYNYRMTDIQAALGLSQLSRLDSFLARRRQLVAQYNSLLKNSDIVVPNQSAFTNPSWHLYCIQLPEHVNRKAVFDHMRKNKIGVQVLYIPVHTQPFYHDLGFREGMYKNAENFYDRSFALPLYPSLSDDQQQHVVSVLLDYS